jgi:hypothetical protein
VYVHKSTRQQQNRILSPSLASGSVQRAPEKPSKLNQGRDGDGAVVLGGDAGRGASAGHGGGAGPRCRGQAGARAQLGVHGRGAQYVGLPAVRDGGEQDAAPRQAVLPGGGGPARVAPHLPLPAARRRRRVLRRRRRLQARARAPGHLQTHRAARQRLRRYRSYPSRDSTMFP